MVEPICPKHPQSNLWHHHDGVRCSVCGELLKVPRGYVEIRRFLSVMEEKLRENDHKGNWAQSSVGELYDMLQTEMHELKVALNRLGRRMHGIGEPSTLKELEERFIDVVKECADVANFAFFIADMCRP